MKKLTILLLSILTFSCSLDNSADLEEVVNLDEVENNEPDQPSTFESNDPDNDTRLYKVITGLITQLDSSFPEVVILENTSGSTINGRGVIASGDGGCTISFTGTLFADTDKVYYNLNDNIDYNVSRVLKMDIWSVSTVIFRGFENGTGKRGLFNKVPFEIRIYD